MARAGQPNRRRRGQPSSETPALRVLRTLLLADAQNDEQTVALIIDFPPLAAAWARGRTTRRAN